MHKTRNNIISINFRRIGISPMLLLAMFLLLQNGCKDYSKDTPAPITVTDNSGYVYHTVIIGTQVWMAENLRTTKYRNGDPIKNVTDEYEWASLTTGAYCLYNNDPTMLKNDYGFLYNGYAVSDNRNIAPIGWHVPTDEDWAILANYLGGDKYAGASLKETGTTNWLAPNTGASNRTGFSALPGGYRCSYGHYHILGEGCYLWSSTPYSTFGVWTRYLSYNGRILTRGYNVESNGFSVRCVRDY